MEFGLVRGVRGHTLDEDRVVLFSNLSPGPLQFFNVRAQQDDVLLLCEKEQWLPFKFQSGK